MRAKHRCSETQINMPAKFEFVNLGSSQLVGGVNRFGLKFDEALRENVLPVNQVQSL